MAAGEFEHRAREQQQREQIGNGHQAVECVRNTPDDATITHQRTDSDLRGPAL